MPFRLISAGVSDYADTDIQRLPPCDRDAQSIFDALTDAENGLCHSPESVTLRSSDDGGKKSTRANLLHQIKRLSFFSQPDDGLVFYFSGHGASNRTDAYLLCQDTYDSNLEDTGLQIKWVTKTLTESRARFKIVILDCCKPGRLIGKQETGAMDGVFESCLPGDAGLVILTACSADQVAHLLPDDSESVFTHFILECLSRGSAGESDSISIKELYEYTLEKCRDWSMKNNKQQVPRLAMDGVGDPTRIALARRKNESVSTSPSDPVVGLAKTIMLTSTKIYTYPRDIRIAPEPPNFGYVIGINTSGPRTEYGDVKRDQVPEVKKQALEQGREGLESVAATLTDFYDPGTLLKGSERDFSFPDGQFRYELQENPLECVVAATLQFEVSTVSRAALDMLQRIHRWGTLSVSIVPESAPLLSDVVTHVKKSGWRISRFSPERACEVEIQGLGRKSRTARVIFHSGKDKILERVFFDLDTVSEEHTLSALVAEVPKLLPR
jgi:uncharacterized caspase-like protein